MIKGKKMKSKPFKTAQIAVDEVKENKSFDFGKLYSSVAETKVKQFETNDWSKIKKINKKPQSELDTPKCSQSPNKSTKKNKNELLDLSNKEAVEFSSLTKPSRKISLTSSGNNKRERSDNSVKSIMKNKMGVVKSLVNISNDSTLRSKPKKRNKSVSYMLDDAEEIVVKKIKSNDSNKEHKKQDKKNKNATKSTNSKIYKQTKNYQLNENKMLDDDNIKLDRKEELLTDTLKRDHIREPTQDITITETVNKKMKKAKNSSLQTEVEIEINKDQGTNELNSEIKTKISRKKKRKVKSIQDGKLETEGEPVVKARKKDLKPETIAKGLENLNIGDNAHTLTNLLDEMTVVDKNKKKKDRQKQRAQKNKNTINSKKEEPQRDSNTEKEQVKWSNRKWNKDTKSDGRLRLLSSVVVENLPIKIMCNYKTLVSEHFGKYGTITGIGVAEAYPSEDPKPVFTTTVFFQDEEAATKALEEDNTAFKSNRIRVRRPLPPEETTLVVRAYSLTDQALSSLFSAAGRIRAIRQMIKGKKSISTAFVEFDGPEAVERALKMAENTKINGKKMFLSKFENRKKGKSPQSKNDHINKDNNDSITE